ncbi:hypothetical protein SAMN04487859_116128 [Roseovarius lutimaris]|uniref:Uncharacterized protein n=1 Tax=Roseovarius lutimaris TaxID=1005928 RepID=A0A1I5ENA6_9RHOB|nr:hypothetical protein [Roseovarius lutimaris]SFO12958.1 hypothetical protein SAMN04487859_116128 [Roseovarius lutimaris]
MSNVSIEIRADGDLNNILDPDERVLWTGRPEYGRGLCQAIGAERIYLISMLVGVLVMWGTVPFIGPASSSVRFTACMVYGAVSLAFLAAAFMMASNRQYVLWNVMYLVTNKRAIVCRRGRNWRFAVRLYVVSNVHSATYPYEIVPTRPNPSLKIGTLFDEQELQPFGHGLSHPGQPVTWGALTMPVAFEQVSNTPELLEMIKSNLRS